MERIITLSQLAKCLADKLNEPVFCHLVNGVYIFTTLDNNIVAKVPSAKVLGVGFGEPYLDYALLSQRFSSIISTKFIKFEHLYYYTYLIEI